MQELLLASFGVLAYPHLLVPLPIANIAGPAAFLRAKAFGGKKSEKKTLLF